MANLGKTLFHVRQALARALAGEAPVDPLEAEKASDEPAPALPAVESGNGPAGEAHAEFNELLGALGAEPADTSVLERKEREIAELQRNLEMLRPIGDELARVERQRLAEKAEHEREVAGLRQQVALGRSSQEAAVARQIDAVLSTIAELETTEIATALEPDAAALPLEPARAGENEVASPKSKTLHELERALEDSRAEVCRLSGCVGELSDELAKRAKALEHSEDARKSLRARFEERDRLATERWHELRRVKKRLRENEQELARARSTRTPGGATPPESSHKVE